VGDGRSHSGAGLLAQVVPARRGLARRRVELRKVGRLAVSACSERSLGGVAGAAQDAGTTVDPASVENQMERRLIQGVRRFSPATRPGARHAFEKAARLAASLPERRYLEARADRLNITNA
jgi:hypothetical protein